MLLTEAAVGGRPARAWTGGEAETLVLVHGGWGGAAMHWAPVWDRLAQRFRLIAPELPGVGDRSVPGLSSFDAYAGWIEQLLSALNVPHAWCVGNSFGAAVVWELAARLGPRCRGAVLVNGMPFDAPPPLRRLAAIGPVRRLLRALYRKTAFNPAVLPRAFADPTLAPAELTRVLSDPPPEQVDLMLTVACGGGRPDPPPGVPVLIVWGEDDRLPGTSPETARRLKRRIPGAKLVFIPKAGHCPQIERPAEFVDAIASFATSIPGSGGKDGRSRTR